MRAQVHAGQSEPARPQRKEVLRSRGLHWPQGQGPRSSSIALGAVACARVPFRTLFPWAARDFK